MMTPRTMTDRSRTAAQYREALRANTDAWYDDRITFEATPTLIVEVMDGAMSLLDRVVL